MSSAASLTLKACACTTSVPHRPAAAWRSGTSATCPTRGPTSEAPPGTATTPTTRRTVTSGEVGHRTEHDRSGPRVELEPQTGSRRSHSAADSQPPARRSGPGEAGRPAEPACPDPGRYPPHPWITPTDPPSGPSRGFGPRVDQLRLLHGPVQRPALVPRLCRLVGARGRTVWSGIWAAIRHHVRREASITSSSHAVANVWSTETPSARPAVIRSVTSWQSGALIRDG